jgi:hypothetical protein
MKCKIQAKEYFKYWIKENISSINQWMNQKWAALIKLDKHRIQVLIVEVIVLMKLKG